MDMNRIKRIGLIAHDACKNDLIDWVTVNAEKLVHHKMYCTGTTGRLVQEAFAEKFPAMTPDITRYKSGPLGGDQQVGALIASDQLDILIFFTDPMTLQPHDVDVKALLRISGIANIVVANTRSTADFIIASPLFDEEYQITGRNYDDYVLRIVG